MIFEFCDTVLELLSGVLRVMVPFCISKSDRKPKFRSWIFVSAVSGRVEKNWKNLFLEFFSFRSY